MESRSDLRDIFRRQEEFMELLKEKGRMPQWPFDLTSKSGQRLIKETIFNMFEEATEASAVLKNKAHRLTDDRKVDVAHYREELGDAFAFFIEVCIMSGMTADDLYDQFCKKNQAVKERLQNGY